MFEEVKKIPVFVKRDFKILLAYKLAFSISVFEIVFNLFYLVLFGKMFGEASLPYLPPAYNGDFLSYILVGSIGWGFLWSIMNATSSSLSTEMMMGTFESILLTSTKIHTIILSYALFGCIFGGITVGILFVVGLILFGVSAFSSASIFTLIIFILSATMMTGLGMILGGFTIWLKNIGDTVPLLQNIAMFFCGVYFPIEVLPNYLQPVSKFMPFFYSVQGLRVSLIPSSIFSEIMYYIAMLLLLSIVFITFGLIVLKAGVDKARKEGSLAYY